MKRLRQYFRVDVLRDDVVFQCQRGAQRPDDTFEGKRSQIPGAFGVLGSVEVECPAVRELEVDEEALDEDRGHAGGTKCITVSSLGHGEGSHCVLTVRRIR